MEIKVSRHSGFCFGVKRAMEITLFQESKDKKNKKPEKIATYGPLIHNPQVVEKLKQSGIDVITEINENTTYDKIIMPSHGVPKELFDKCKKLGIEAIDATCTFVNVVHEKVKSYRELGYLVVIVGDSGHSEVKGIMSSADYDCIVISSEEDILKHDFKGKKVGIVSQTTNSPEFFGSIAGKISALAEETHVANTICYATHKRQKAVADLAPNVDLMLIIGGKNSANTNRLYQISYSVNKNTYHIETADELNFDKFKDVKVVGITAGASTPDWIIDEVINKLKEV